MKTITSPKSQSTLPAHSRRDFVKTLASVSLAAFAAPWIIPAGVVRAQDGKPVPSNRTTFALIGSGNQGRQGLGDVLRNPAAQVIGVCDVFKNRATAGQKQVDAHYKTKGCAVYGDFRELLARKDLDCVEVATADHWHVPIALAAVRAGKDVYVEKPLSVAMKWSFALREEINKRKAVFQFGTWQRSRRHFRHACELVRNGVLGKIIRVETWSDGLVTNDGGIFNKKSRCYRQHLATEAIPVPVDLDYELWQGPAPRRPFTRVHHYPSLIYHNYDYAIGYIGGWGIHPVDIAQWGLGTDDTAPISYKGTGRFAEEAGLFNTTAAWDVECQYANGTEMRFMDFATARTVVPKYYKHLRDHGTTFFGEKGWITVNRTNAVASDKELLKANLGENAIRLHASPNDNQWADFIARVKDRKPTINPIESAVNGDAVCHLSDISIRTGRKITWDPKGEKIVNDAGAEKYLDRTLHAPWTL